MHTPDRDVRGTVSRRACLGVIGAATVTPLLTTQAVMASDYEHVVDMVEAGADNSGDEPIDDVFDEHANDDTLLEFPAGEYRANHLGLYDLTHFAMVGEDATLVPGDRYDEYEADWISGMATRDVRIENFTLDVTEDGVGPQIDVNADDDLVVRDIHLNGRIDDGNVALGFHTNTDEGTALLENIRAPDGGDCVGLFVGSEGPVTVRNCHLAGFVDNGLYGSTGSAPVHVEGGTFRNNNVAQVRLGSANSSVRGATIEVDRRVPADRDIVNMRGVRISDGPGPVVVEDCEFRMTGGEGSGAIVGAFDGGSFRVNDSRIYVGSEYTTLGSNGSRTSFGIFVDDSTDGVPGERTIENVSITGGGEFRSAILFRRDDNTVRNTCIEQFGEGRNGITLVNAENNAIADTTINVPDEEIRLRDSTVRKRGIETEGTCPEPGESTDGGSGSDPTTDLGSLERDQSGPEEWHAVGFGQSFDTPVAVAGPVSANGPEPSHVRLRDVGSDGLAVRLEEWLYLDGVHVTERTDYLVAEAGTYTVDELAMEVGRVDGDHWFRPIDFDQEFDATPVVFPRPQTYNGPNPIVPRLRDVSTAGAYVLLDEEEGESHGGAHRTETVGYVAVEPGSGTLGGRQFEVGAFTDVDGGWRRFEFNGTYEKPRFIAAIQTHNESDTANPRFRNLDGSGVDVRIEEERSADSTTTHGPERLGAFVIEGA